MVEDINIKSAEESDFQRNYRSGTLEEGTMFLSEEKASSGITELADLLSKSSQMEDKLEEIFDKFSNLRGFRGLEQVAYKEDNLFYNLAFDGNDYDNDSSADLNAKAKEYDELQNSALSAAKRGYIDYIIKADEARKYIIGAFEMLYSKREDRPFKKHGTV